MRGRWHEERAAAAKVGSGKEGRNPGKDIRVVTGTKLWRKALWAVLPRRPTPDPTVTLDAIFVGFVGFLSFLARQVLLQ